MNVYYVATYVLRFIVLNFKIKPIHKLKYILKDIEYTNNLTYRIGFYRIDITNVIVKRVTINSFKNFFSVYRNFYYY